MKKIILLFAFSAFIVQLLTAQSFTLSNHAGALEHEDVIEMYASPHVDVIEAHIYMTNVSENDIELTVKKEELEILEGTMNTFCFNNICFAPMVIEAPNPLTLEPGETTDATGFYGDYYPLGHSGTSIIRYTFFDVHNADDSISVTVKYTTREPSFQLSTANGFLTGDTIVEVLGMPDEDVIKAYIFLTNVSMEDRHVHAKKEEIEILEGTWNTFCFGGTCFDPGVFVSTRSMLLEPGQTTTAEDFYADYIPNEKEGITLIRYTFFDEEQINDSISVVVKFNTGNVGIGQRLLASSSSISRPFPNPATSIVSFDIDLHPQVNHAELVIMNLLGSVVAKHDVNAGSGRITLPVNNLPEGMYFYTLFVDGQHPVQTGRMIVNR